MPNGITFENLSADQIANIKTVIAVGKEMGISPYGHVVAIATIFQESGAKNINYGDRDSLGLFQQRASWGSAQERTTPAISARKFYAALKQVKGWENMPVTVAAQKVQRSAYPLAYAKWEQLARQCVTSFSPGAVISGPMGTVSQDGATAAATGGIADPLGGITQAISFVANNLVKVIIGIALVALALFRITNADQIVITAAKAYATKGASLIK